MPCWRCFSRVLISVMIISQYFACVSRICHENAGFSFRNSKNFQRIIKKNWLKPRNPWRLMTVKVNTNKCICYFYLEKLVVVDDI